MLGLRRALAWFRAAAAGEMLGRRRRIHRALANAAAGAQSRCGGRRTYRRDPGVAIHAYSVTRTCGLHMLAGWQETKVSDPKDGASTVVAPMGLRMGSAQGVSKYTHGTGAQQTRPTHPSAHTSQDG